MEDKVSTSTASSSKMKIVKLSYGGNTFQVNLDEQEADRLMTNTEYALEYAKLLHERSELVEELVLHESECVQNFPNDSEAMSAVESVENQISEESNVTQVEVQFNSDYDKCDSFNIVNSSDEFKWTHQSTMLLIENRASLNAEFLSPNVRKNKLWARVAKIINSSMNLNPEVNGIQCDSKWRNLLSRYRAIKSKVSKLGKKAKVRWEYFQLMENIEKEREKVINNSTNDSTDENAAAILQAMSHSPILDESEDSISLESLDSDSEEQVNLDANSLNLRTNYSSLVDILKKHRDSRKRKTDGRDDSQPPRWFLKYVKERKEADAKRDEEETKRWTEFQKLEKRKIRAFESLTAVLLETLTKKK